MLSRSFRKTLGIKSSKSNCSYDKVESNPTKFIEQCCSSDITKSNNRQNKCRIAHNLLIHNTQSSNNNDDDDDDDDVDESPIIVTRPRSRSVIRRSNNNDDDEDEETKKKEHEKNVQIILKHSRGPSKSSGIQTTIQADRKRKNKGGKKTQKRRRNRKN